MTKLLVEDERCIGVVALDQRSGRFDAITAKATILATGGLYWLDPTVALIISGLRLVTA